MSEHFGKPLEVCVRCGVSCLRRVFGFTLYTASHTFALKKIFWVKKEKLEPKYLEDEYTFPNIIADYTTLHKVFFRFQCCHI